MKILKKALLLVIAVLILAAVPVAASAEYQFSTVPFTHYASGGITEELEAVILMENSNSTFTKYQVAFPSCTCRDAASNYWSVMYIELLNTKETRAEAKIRSVSFNENKDVRVGMWGDSDPIMGHPEYTSDYMNENFVQKLVGRTKADFDSWEGYGKQVDGVEVDAVTGATVSTSNISSVIRGLFEYHCNKYYKDKA